MGDDVGRLHRCIRDLAALNALPSMCIGRTPDEALDIVVDALPTALSCDLVFVSLPAKDRALVRGNIVADGDLAELKRALGVGADGIRVVTVSGAGELWCLDAELPIGTERGRLVAGRTTPLDLETDRVLVRSAANLVGTTLETARVLENANRKDEFLAMLGHELRNPLAPILTAVELLARHPESAREQDVIERHTRHLARLVDDLLDISRVTRGHIELRRERLALESVLERAVEIAQPLVARYQHTLDVASAAGIAVEADAVRLAQVFGNLLTNAAKFTPPGGRIQVTVDRSNGRVRVAVHDNGRGIERDQLARIFEPFVQVDRAHDAMRGGLGLGLAIVKNLVEQHGGTISVASRGVALGTTFTVDLPTTIAVEVPPSEPAPHAPASRKGVRVLVVDDNIDIAELLGEALEQAGFEIVIAHDGPAAIEKWRTFLPHAAVLDVGLPDLDGYDLARALRAEHGTGPTLIAATGYGQRSDRIRATEAGFDCHFVKPVSIRDLVAALDERVVTANRAVG